MIYHVLPEWEDFSASHGGSISRDIANMMAFDSRRIVVCRAADGTWGFDGDRVLVINALSRYGAMRGRRHLPTTVTGPVFRRIFKPLISRLKLGDIVWCHSQPAVCAALGNMIQSAGAKLIYHSHSSLSFYAKRKEFCLFRADAYIFVSDFMRRESISFFPNMRNTYAIHNGADEALFYPQTSRSLPVNTSPVVLYVGRLHPTKGVHVLMEAMRILQARGISGFCRVVGSSAFGGSRTTRYVRSLLRNCPENMQFVGHRSGREIGDEHRSADILCCPSIWQEPFGNVNIEAMACRVPVIATRVGGIPEIAAEGGVVLVEPDAAEELADALQRLLTNSELRAEIGAQGLKSFRRRFTWGAIHRQYEEVVDHLHTTTAMMQA